MKIAVYAISKNEEQFVQRFCQSAKDADYIIIADTGSTDDTVKVARECGATVHDIRIRPWRFEHARNAALALVPDDVDVCVSIDIDEIMTPGWRKTIESIWTEDTTRLMYLYDWGHNLTFYTSKIHARWGHVWNYPCHEYVEADGRVTEKYAYTNELLVQHFPDPTKSRSNYMELLTCAVKERPECQRSQWYYARELVYNNRFEEAEAEFRKCMDIAHKYSDHENDYVRRHLAQALEKQGKTGEAHRWYRQATALWPNAREPWCDLADFCHKNGLWEECAYAAKQALAINHRDIHHTSEASCWGARPYDALALASYYLGHNQLAYDMGTQALAYNPDDERLQKNMEFYKAGLTPATEMLPTVTSGSNLLFKNIK